MTEAALKGIRAVLYDFDGTLADSTELIMRCYRHTMRTHLGQVPGDDVWLSGFGMTLESQMRRFGRDPAEVEAMLDTYREYQNGIHDDLLLLNYQLDEGEITEEEFLEREAEIMVQLRAAREYRKQRDGQG
jgi:phosphoglycolate phosphatase-like HAD superfamily hydrolase